MQIYVRNFNNKITKNEILKLFSEYGAVDSVRFIPEKDVSAAYVEMPKIKQAEKAIEKLNRDILTGYYLQINKARSGLKDRRKDYRMGGRRLSDLSDN